MPFDHGQVEELKRCYPEPKLLEDGGVDFILISPLHLPPGCNPGLVDGLLCPSPRDGYTSRLFVSAKVVHKGPGQNWSPQDGVVLVSRRWWAVSWKTNQDKLTLLGMVMAHLDAFK